MLIPVKIGVHRVEMQYWPELLKIIDGGLSLNPAQVARYAELLARKLRDDGQPQLADRVVELMNRRAGTLLQSTGGPNGGRLPLDQDSRLPVIDIIDSAGDEPRVVLNSRASAELERFVSYCAQTSAFIEAGLTQPNTLLLYGPPGCGKTLAARHIAHRLGLPLFLARLDTLISSFLGSTSKNIRHVFDYARERPSVLFLDEFDAIAKVRDDVHELGELKRVVNSLLQNIDDFGSQGVIVAATNHEHMLDPAVWRRFTAVIKLGLPDVSCRVELVRLFTRAFSIDDTLVEMLSTLFDGISGSEIETICTRALRDMVLRGARVPSPQDFCGAFFSYRLAAQEGPTTLLQEVTFLRSRGFTFTQIGQLLGCSKQRAHQVFSKGVKSSANAPAFD